MIEMYLAASLLGIGYIFNKYNSETVHAQQEQVNTKPIQNMIPSKGSFVPKTLNIERQHVQRAYNNKSNEKYFKSELLDKDIYVDKVHNNMVPFFSGSSTGQNVDDTANISILERFGVNNENYKPKQEMAPLFGPTPTMPISTRNTLDTMYERSYVSKIQNNVLPFNQQKVGPGLGKDFSAKPSGGFHQNATDLIVKDIPTVDTLRAKNNPKKTYAGRVVEGLQERKRPADICMSTKEDKVLVKKRTHADLFNTTGAVLKSKQHAKPIYKETNRQVSKEYSGNPHNNQASIIRSKVKNPSNQNLSELPTGIASLTSAANKKDDYGKSSIQVYGNERDITSTKTYQGNVTSVIKSIIAPLTDLVKHSKKELFVEHSREFGNMSVQIPEKQIVKDPNDVMRTTIKETMIHNSQNLNLKGPALKSTVYDPNDVMRTTIKETTIHNSQNLNLKGQVFKSIAYDPNSIARTTIKETLLHDTQPANVRVYETKVTARDKDEKARVTHRETLDDVDGNLNIGGPKQSSTYPDDVARTTIKETTLADKTGNIDSMDNRNAAYVNLNMEAKMTMKETYEDSEYMGGANISNADGYKVTNAEVKTTLREESEEYFGGAGDTNAKKQMDNTSVLENAEMNEIRSLTIEQRPPTKEGVKVGSGTDSVNVDIKKLEEDNIVNDFKDRIVNKMNDECFSEITKTKQDIDNRDTRLDVEILEPYKKNPYTLPLPNVTN